MMTNAHLFIVVFFGTLLAVNCINYRRAKRRMDREDEAIERAIETIKRVRKEIEDRHG